MLDSSGIIVVVVSRSLFELATAVETGRGAAATCDAKIDLTPDAESRSKKSIWNLKRLRFV